MLPWVYDFRWEPTHLVFLGVFFTVVLTMAATLTVAGLRTVRDLRQGKADAIRWAEEFHELPAASKVCRHELTGEVARRTCAKGFDCRTCEGHEASRSDAPDAPPGSPGGAGVLGFRMPSDRLYHRGHTWVRPEADGTVTVGPDAFASRLIGKPDRVHLPEPGSRLTVNGTAWRVRKGTAEARVLSPVDGTVTEHGRDGEDWLLRVRPAGGRLDGRHLLRGAEVGPWIAREVERLQKLLSGGVIGHSLADGGMPVQDLASAIPESKRDEVLGEMLLEP